MIHFLSIHYFEAVSFRFPHDLVDPVILSEDARKSKDVRTCGLIFLWFRLAESASRAEHGYVPLQFGDDRAVSFAVASAVVAIHDETSWRDGEGGIQPALKLAEAQKSTRTTKPVRRSRRKTGWRVRAVCDERMRQTVLVLLR